MFLLIKISVRFIIILNSDDDRSLKCLQSQKFVPVFEKNIYRHKMFLP